jgi:hypothetical protein
VSQVRRERRPLRREAVERGGGEAERRKEQQSGEKRPAQRGGVAQRGRDADRAGRGQGALRPVGLDHLPPRGVLERLRRSHEHGLLGEQPLHRGTCDDERRRLPNEERSEGIAPGRARTAAQERDGTQQAEQDEHRYRGDEEPGELAEELSAACC